LFTTMGMYGRSLNSSLSNGIMGIEILNNIFSGKLYIFILFGVFAAVMSSADSFLNVASINLSRLFYPQKWNRYLKGEDKGESLLTFTKRMVVVVGIISIAVALLIPDIVDLFIGSFSLILILLPATISAIFENKPNSKGAFYSIFWGIALFLLLFLFIPQIRKLAFIPSVFLSVAVYFFFKIKGDK